MTLQNISPAFMNNEGTLGLPLPVITDAIEKAIEEALVSFRNKLTKAKMAEFSTSAIRLRARSISNEKIPNRYEINGKVFAQMILAVATEKKNPAMKVSLVSKTRTHILNGHEIVSQNPYLRIEWP